MMTTPEIINRLNQQYQSFADDLNKLSARDFTFSLPNKWNAGQQLDHIYRSISPLSMILKSPALLLEYNFGKTDRLSRTYDGMVSEYLLQLQKSPIANARFLPGEIKVDEKQNLIKSLMVEVVDLCINLKNFSDEDFDRFLIPHPLLGSLTLREMLYFTIYHVSHHHKLTLQNLHYAKV